MEIPTKIILQKAEIIKAIGSSKNGKLGNDKIREIIPEELHERLGKVVSNLKTVGWLESEKSLGINVEYYLTPAGQKLYKSIMSGKTVVVPQTEKRVYKKRDKSTPPPPPAPAPEQFQINISSTANSVADQITALIDENASSRKLMMNVVVMITRAYGQEFVKELARSFGLTLIEDNNDGNGTTD